MLDTAAQPLFQINKSGHVYYWEGGKKLHIEVLDSLWFSKADRQHFALDVGHAGHGASPADC